MLEVDGIETFCGQSQVLFGMSLKIETGEMVMLLGRVLLLAEPPSIDANEITDKGYINQRAVLERRSDLVETLYGDGSKVLSAGVLSAGVLSIE